MARVTTHLGSRRRNRLTTLLQRGPGSESAGYHYNAVPKHPAPTKTPTVAPPPSEAATSPAGNYAGASHEYHQAVAALPGPARTVTEKAAVAASPLAPLTSLLGPSSTHSLFASLGTAPASPLSPAVPTPIVVPPALEKKTIGSPTLEEILDAGKAGTLRVSQGGAISTPRVRSALGDLRSAQHRVDATGGVTTGLGPNADAFANALAASTPLTPREAGAWTLAEGGAYENGGAAGPQNWLGIGYPGHPTPFGQSPYFSGSPARAGRAAGQWMRGRIGGDYGYKAASGVQQILPAAKQGGEQGFLSGLQASGWGTDVSHVAQNLGAVKVSQPSTQDVQALRVAKQHARAVGVNPTRFNGDVERGPSPDTVFVRADAQGMVHWAESAVGTPEGSGKQQRWAGQFGLGASEPWCANFVGAGLSRRGVTPPANPNYSGSYLDPSWKGGTQIGKDVSKAKPGDLMVFGANEHIGLYVGNGEVVAGNYGDEVARYQVSDDSRGVSGIVRPHYQGGKVAVQESTPLPGSTAGGTFGTPSSGAVGGAVPAAGGSGGLGLGQGAPVALTQLAPPLGAGPVLPGIPGQEGDSGASAEDLLALLESTPTALRSGRRSRRIG